MVFYCLMVMLAVSTFCPRLSVTKTSKMFYRYDICVITIVVYVNCYVLSPHNSMNNLAAQHDRVRQQYNLTSLVWNENLVAESRLLARWCDISYENSFLLRNKDIYVADVDSASTIDAMNVFLLKRAYDPGRHNASCCSVTNDCCCQYARVTNPDFVEYGCAFDICSNLKVMSGTLHDMLVIICSYATQELINTFYNYVPIPQTL